MSKSNAAPRIKPTLYDRSVIWCLTHIPRANFIIQHGLAEAYDRGYSHGIVQGSKINGKTSQRKAKKIIRDAYRVKGES